MLYFLGHRIYLFSCPIGDGWLPFLGPKATSFYRKRRRILIDLRLTSFEGLDMIFMFVYLFVFIFFLFLLLVPERSLFCFFPHLCIRAFHARTS